MHTSIMNLRDIRQQEACDSYTGNYWALIKAAPRFGKIKVTIDILRKYGLKKILVCAPRVDIHDSWKKDFKKWEWEGDVTYTTFLSLSKIKDKYDIVIIDEIHECSSNQLKTIKSLNPDKLLALSGTISQKTEKEISELADIHVCYEYSIEQAVEEGILCDYTISIHKIPLEKKEKTKFVRLEKAMERLQENGKDTFYLYLQQIRLIQGSIAKRDKTKEILDSNKDKRILCFCGTTEIADSLGAPVYHSKSREKSILSSFCNGEGNHLVTIKMAQAGLTIVPINIGLINYTSGNPEDNAQKICRFLGLEYDNPEKKAHIHMIVSTEKFETDRLSTALMFFDESKINYI